MLELLRRGLSRRGRRALLAILVGLALLSSLSAVALLRARNAAAATPPNAVLLMIHGFSDDCATAFDRSESGVDQESTWTYFTSGPTGWDSAHIKFVGYYSDNDDAVGYNDGATVKYCTDNLAFTNPNNGSCDQYFNVSSAPTPYVTQNAKGTTSDPIRHLGCLLAWYIASLGGVPVYILAHSMGGLIVRDALGESGTSAGFPTTKPDVRTVVTVGTPHGGLSGLYLQLAQLKFRVPGLAVPREVWDMDSGSGGSGFMPMLFGSQFQSPQGSNGTVWDLIASSVPGYVPPAYPLPGGNSLCDPNAPASLLFCAFEDGHQNDPYPDGDGVVQADSALSMAGANYKALYGAVNDCGAFVPLAGCDVQYSPAPTTGSTMRYTHEAGSCQNLPNGGTACLAAPFLLNDASTDSTYAWVCWSGSSTCNSGASGTGGINDLHVDDPNKPNAQYVSRSLALMLALLPKPSAAPTPCASTTETDDNERASYVDNRGNAWHVYVDLKRDATTGVACQMQVVARIFPPGPDGAWAGKLAVMSYNGSNLVSGSSQTFNGSTAYPGHGVWRGPWFNVSPGNTYSAKTVEYNGSTSYLRARGYIGL